MARKRRGKGEGSLFQRADGLWTGTLDLGLDANGKRKRRTIYDKSKAKLIEKLTRLKGEALNGTLSDTTRLTVAYYLENHWLDDDVRLNARKGTYIDYKALVKNHINPHLGGLQLVKLTPLHINGLYARMEQAGTSPRIRQKVHAVLHRALNQAVRWGLLQRNVCAAATRPRVAKKEVAVLTPDQTSRFLKFSEGDRLHALYVLAVTTGLRQGELLGLQWADVDMKRKRLSVVRTLLEHSGKHEVGEPKSEKGRRVVTLPEIAVKALKEHRKRMLTEGNSDQWVFCDTAGGPLRKSNLMRRSFKPILTKADLPMIRFHDLRHTAATLLLQQGVHAKIVQERLGHSQISLTMDTYSHVLPSMQEEAARSLDRLFDQARSG